MSQERSLEQGLSIWALASGLPYRSPGVSGLHGQQRLGLHTLPPAFYPAGGEVILTGQESSGGSGMHGGAGRGVVRGSERAPRRPCTGETVSPEQGREGLGGL